MRWGCHQQVPTDVSQKYSILRIHVFVCTFCIAYFLLPGIWVTFLISKFIFAEGSGLILNLLLFFPDGFITLTLSRSSQACAQLSLMLDFKDTLAPEIYRDTIFQPTQILSEHLALFWFLWFVGLIDRLLVPASLISTFSDWLFAEINHQHRTYDIINKSVIDS